MRRFKIIVAAVALLGLAAPVLAAQESAAQSANTEITMTANTEITMTAKKYEFSPNVVTVRQGAHVKLVITALDRDHGFKLAAYHINQRLKKGEPETIEFTADRAGTFPFECSVVCGLGHHRMKGKLVVEPAAEKP
jgi:heme/copper-type cytochrome/quinol oxidase subunit 2